tara:strand:- start:2779 stop:3147 length:369 start_codon:yes stop_codon:yes gene_type:complete
MSSILKILFYCLAYAILNVAGSTIIKNKLLNKNLNTFSDFITLILDYKIISAFIIIFLSALLMFKALSLGKFSVIIPFATGINFIITVGVGILYFKDKITYLNIAGIILILVGVILISFNQK